MRIAIGIEYDGSQFNGWQTQDHGRTVQDCVEKALTFVANEEIKVQCAGRTDTGVHALYQVAHFDTDSTRQSHSWVFGTNSQLESDVNLLWAYQVDDEFHARFDATARSYRYILLNRSARSSVLANKVSWECRELNLHNMKLAAAYLTGKHDFSAFRAIGCQAHSPIREVTQLTLKRTGDFIVLDITANAFLQHMVRNIVGVLLEIGTGKREPDWAQEVLESLDRTQGGMTAPAEGLYLVGVEYPDRYDLPITDQEQWPMCL